MNQRPSGGMGRLLSHPKTTGPVSSVGGAEARVSMGGATRQVYASSHLSPQHALTDRQSTATPMGTEERCSRTMHMQAYC